MSDLLREVLAERSAEPASPTEIRLVRVRRRIVRRQRVRTAVVAGVAAAVALALLGLAILTLGPAGIHAAPYASPAPSVAGFPAYSEGAHIVAGAQATQPTTSVTVMYTPATTSLMLFWQCDSPGFTAEIRVGTTVVHSGGCDRENSLSLAPLHDLDLAAGRPTEFTMTVHPASAAVDPGSVFRLGIGELVAFDDYPFPAAPAPSASLPQPSGPSARGGDDSLAPRQITFTWTGKCQLLVQLQGPGQLAVNLNGVRIALVQQWDYLIAPHYVGLNQTNVPEAEVGDSIRITLIPLHMKGDWVASIVPS
jgi:hypothetical protein